MGMSCSPSLRPRRAPLWPPSHPDPALARLAFLRLLAGWRSRHCSGELEVGDRLGPVVFVMAEVRACYRQSKRMIPVSAASASISILCKQAHRNGLAVGQDAPGDPSISCSGTSTGQKQKPRLIVKRTA